MLQSTFLPYVDPGFGTRSLSIHRTIPVHSTGERFLACLDLTPRTGGRLDATPRSLNDSVRSRLLLPGDLYNMHNIEVSTRLHIISLKA